MVELMDMHLHNTIRIKTLKLYVQLPCLQPPALCQPAALDLQRQSTQRAGR